MSGKDLEIGVANLALARGLHILQESDDARARAAARRDMDAILYGAIDTFPDRVNAVVIDATVDLSAGLGGERPSDAHTDEIRGREDMQGYFERRNIPTDRPSNVVLTMPLPYASRGIVGAAKGEFRQPCGRICETVGVNLPSLVDGKPSVIVSNGGIAYRWEGAVLADELHSIRLEQVPEADFAKTYAVGRTAIADSSLEHYLSYLGFDSQPGHQLPKIEEGTSFRADVTEARKKAAGVYMSTSAPFLVTPLVGEYPVRGFAAERTDEGVVLHEFGQFNPPRRVRTCSPGSYHVAFAWAMDNKHAKTYEGADAIRRLHEVKVAGRIK